MINLNRGMSKPLAISIIVVLVVLVIGGVFVYQYYMIVKEEPEEKIKTPGDETADWKIYRNEEYGFEIKYPKDWTFQAIKYSEDFDFSEENPEAFVRFYPTSKRWINFINEADVFPIGILIFRGSSQQFLLKFSEKDKKEVLINDMLVTEIEGKIYLFNRSRSDGYIVISNSIFELMIRLELLFKTKFPEQDKFHANFDQMLFTFRFLE